MKIKSSEQKSGKKSERKSWIECNIFVSEKTVYSFQENFVTNYELFSPKITFNFTKLKIVNHSDRITI